MLKIEMDDVIGVLQSCKVQIGVIVGVLALLVIALIACRKMKKSQKFLIRSLTKSCWISTALILLIVRKCLFRSRAGLCRSLLLVLTLRK